MRKHFRITSFLTAAILGLLMLGSDTSRAAGFDFPLDSDGKLIIVIDPGHGGDNDGAITEHYVEKEVTMKVANAMRDELEKYDDITIYFTHESIDKSMTIKQRCEYAKKVNADYMFCLHFNMSSEHELYGSEVWISNRGACNREGYRFGYILMQTFEEMGLFNRGVKTRNQSDGDNYYGINRYSTEFGIPTALIEHAHMDHDRDWSFIDSEEDFDALGRADATAVAKYFGLKSQSLGVDYSDGGYAPEVENGVVYCSEDTTEPDVCEIEAVNADYDNLTIDIKCTATDAQSPILYYAVSLDGGQTFGQFQDWTGTDVLAGTSPDTIDISIDVPDKTKPQIKIKAINQYGYRTESNILSDYEMFEMPEEIVPEEVAIEEASELKEETGKFVFFDNNARNKQIAMIALGICAIALVVAMILTIKKK